MTALLTAVANPLNSFDAWGFRLIAMPADPSRDFYRVNVVPPGALQAHVFEQFGMPEEDAADVTLRKSHELLDRLGGFRTLWWMRIAAIWRLDLMARTAAQLAANKPDDVTINTDRVSLYLTMTADPTAKYSTLILMWGSDAAGQGYEYGFNMRVSTADSGKWKFVAESAPLVTE